MIPAALALLIRWAFLLHQGTLLLPDSLDRYLHIAAGLFQEWRGTVFDAPAYPAFLAFTRLIIDLPWFPLLLQGVLDGTTVFLIYALAHRLGWRRAAMGIALFFALHAGGIVFANAILTETLFSFLVITPVWLLLVFSQNSRWPVMILPGLLLGLAALTRPNGILVLLVLAGVVLLFRWHHHWIKSALCLLTCAAIPIGVWVQHNGRHHDVYVIAQGAGWQWLQNMAWFGLLDPATLPPDEVAHYHDWTSLTDIRSRLFADPAYDRHEIDGLFKRIAQQNALAHPGSYLARIPTALLLPRRFIGDITRVASRPAKWNRMVAEAATRGHETYTKRLEGLPLFTRFFSLLRKLTVSPGKYTLLGLLLVPTLLLSWRDRNGPVFLVAAIPLSQFLILTLMLNPIERYYYPFEPLMILSFFWVLLRIRISKTSLLGVFQPREAGSGGREDENSHHGR